MAKTKRSTPVNASVLGATKVVGTAVAAPAGSGSTAASSTAAGSTGSGNSPAGAVLASLGVMNTGFTTTKASSLATKAFLQKLNQRLNGVENYLPAGTSLLLGGQTYTIASIVSVLEAVIGLFTAKATAQAQAKASVSAAEAALNAQLPVASQFVAELDGALVALLHKGNPVLENFGLSKGVNKTPTVATKMQALGTAELTRKSRNTMGKVQKAKVKGGTATLAVTGPSGQLLSGSTPGAAAASTTPAPAAGSTSSTGSTSGQ